MVGLDKRESLEMLSKLFRLDSLIRVLDFENYKTSSLKFLMSIKVWVEKKLDQKGKVKERRTVKAGGGEDHLLNLHIYLTLQKSVFELYVVKV